MPHPRPVTPSLIDCASSAAPINVASQSAEAEMLARFDPSHHDTGDTEMLQSRWGNHHLRNTYEHHMM